MVTAYKLSVIVPCFNHGEFLSEAVASVKNIKRDDIELIVVDDGSTDNLTRSVMDALCEQRIKVIRQENSGLAAARNSGIRSSTGEYILPLDADNHLRPGYVKHGVGILDANLEVGVVYGDAEYIGMRTGRWHVGPFDLRRLIKSNYIDACALYRRSIWVENRGYDSTMPVQGLEDWDFWLGAVEHGWQFAYVPEVLFDYRVAEESMITRASGHTAQIEEFIAKKHGQLYRETWLSLVSEHESLLTRHQSLLTQTESVRWNFRNLRRLLKSRLRQKLDNGVTSS